MAARGRDDALGSFRLNKVAIAGIAVVSVVYFTDAFLKASQKCFWFDELFTVYLCRLSSFKDTWTAVTQGADFNPPLFYLLTRGAQRLFGEGLIATRLPATIGVWLFCVCLFFFVARHAGAIPGFIAGAFPLFTLVQYYAYEARAHGIVLGWCGLALVCWQRTTDGRARYLWLTAFGLSLMGALLTHVYAVYLVVPFTAVEVYKVVKRSRPNWEITAVLALVPASVILAVYLPLFHLYRTSMPAVYFPVSHDRLQRFLIDAIGPATIILLLWLVLSGLDVIRRGQRTNTTAAIPQREILVAAGFAFIPLIGLIGCKISHGPFLDRYFLSSIAGYAIFLGFASSGLQGYSRIEKALAGCMLVLMVGDLGSTIYLAMKNRVVLEEPSSGLVLSTIPSRPMARYETVLLDNNGLDILVLPNTDYLYFFRYAPPPIVSHLYFGTSADDEFLAAYGALAKGAHIDLKTTTFGSFFATHDRFLLYERANSSHIDALQAIVRAGYGLKSARSDAAGIMYDYAK